LIESRNQRVSYNLTENLPDVRRREINTETQRAQRRREERAIRRGLAPESEH
jgi:hypothetical protein